MKTKINPASEMAKIRWAKTSKKDRKAYSRMMIEAKKAKKSLQNKD